MQATQWINGIFDFGLEHKRPWQTAASVQDLSQSLPGDFVAGAIFN